MSNTRELRYIREIIQNKHASYIKAIKKIGSVQRNDEKMFEQGKFWYDSGHSLRDAEQILQSNMSFVHGYEHAARIDKVNNDLFKLGMEYFEKGIPLVNIPTNYMDKEWFVKGYNEAIRLSLNKKNKISGR